MIDLKTVLKKNPYFFLWTNIKFAVFYKNIGYILTQDWLIKRWVKLGSF